MCNKHLEFNKKTISSAAVRLLVPCWLAVVGCRNPCEELAKKYCDCRESRADRDACHANMAVRKRHYKIQRTENQEACLEILINKTCTCRAVEEDKLGLCGMTRLRADRGQSDGGR